jgi:hypothetical protein
MATQTDPAQLKKLGLVLLVLGLIMAALGLIGLGDTWQLYAGGGAAAVGLALTAFAMKKG